MHLFLILVPLVQINFTWSNSMNTFKEKKKDDFHLLECSRAWLQQEIEQDRASNNLIPHIKMNCADYNRLKPMFYK